MDMVKKLERANQEIHDKEKTIQKLTRERDDLNNATRDLAGKWKEALREKEDLAKQLKQARLGGTSSLRKGEASSSSTERAGINPEADLDANTDQMAIQRQDTTDRSVLRNPERLTLIHTLREHEGSVCSVALSADGQTLVSGGRDNTTKIWNMRTRQLLHTLTGHKDSVYSVALSADGQTLVSGSLDKTIKIWNPKTGRLLHILTGHKDSVSSVVLSADGQTLVSGSGDKTIKLWGEK